MKSSTARKVVSTALKRAIIRLLVADKAPTRKPTQPERVKAPVKLHKAADKKIPLANDPEPVSISKKGPANVIVRDYTSDDSSPSPQSKKRSASPRTAISKRHRSPKGVTAISSIDHLEEALREVKKQVKARPSEESIDEALNNCTSIRSWAEGILSRTSKIEKFINSL